MQPLVSSDEADPFADIENDTEDTDSDFDIMDTELSDLFLDFKIVRMHAQSQI